MQRPLEMLDCWIVFVSVICGLSDLSYQLLRMSLQTNYEHLKQCIESAPVPAMPQHFYDNIIRSIPSQLRVKYAHLLSELHDELTTEYDSTMRKARGYCCHWCGPITRYVVYWCVLDNSVPSLVWMVIRCHFITISAHICYGAIIQVAPLHVVVRPSVHQYGTSSPTDNFWRSEPFCALIVCVCMYSSFQLNYGLCFDLYLSLAFFWIFSWLFHCKYQCSCLPGKIYLRNVSSEACPRGIVG